MIIVLNLQKKKLSAVEMHTNQDTFKAKMGIVPSESYLFYQWDDATLKYFQTIGCVKGDNCTYRFGTSFLLSFTEFFGTEQSEISIGRTGS